MLITISTWTLLLFAALYPLFLWATSAKELGQGFHRLTLGLGSLVAGLGVIFFWLMDVNFLAHLSAVVWLVSLLAVTGFYWSRERVQRWVVTIPSVLGVVVYVRMIAEVISPDLKPLLISIIGGLGFCSAIFSMLLGHYYLNLVNLPIKFLRRSVRLLLAFLIIRGVWDVVHLFVGTVVSDGEVLQLLAFLQSAEGFFLLFALLFGICLPLVLTFFIWRTIALRSTQFATGLLNVVVISVIMGDLFYKYYVLQFGLFL